MLKPTVVMADVGEREVAVAEERQRDEGFRAHAALPPHEDAEHEQADADEQRHREDPADGPPVVGLALLDAEDQAEHADRRRGPRRPGRTSGCASPAGHQPQGEDEADQSDRHVDEEDPLPAGAVDEQAADQRTDERRDPRRGAPQGHRLPALVGGEGPGDDRHGLRRHQRRAQALDDASHDQLGDRPGQPAPQGGGGEQGEPDEIDVLRPEPVTQPAGDEQGHRIRQQVGAGDPDDGVHVGVQPADDRRGRDRHDRRVDEDHEEAQDQCPQRRPGSTVAHFLVAPGVAPGAHRSAHGSAHRLLFVDGHARGSPC